MSFFLRFKHIIRKFFQKHTLGRIAAFIATAAALIAILSWLGVNPVLNNRKNVVKSNLLIEQILEFTEKVNKAQTISNSKSDFDDMVISKYNEQIKQYSGNSPIDHLVKFRTLVMTGIYYQNKGEFKHAISYYQRAISIGLPIADVNVCIADLHYDLAIVDLIRKDRLHIDNANMQLYLSIDEETKTIFTKVKNELENAEKFEYLDDKMRFAVGTIPLEKVNHRKSQINNVLEGSIEIFINNYYEAFYVIDWYEKINSKDRAKLEQIVPMKEHILETAMNIADRAVSEHSGNEKKSLKDMINEASEKVNLYGDEYGARRLLKKATELYPDSAIAHYNYGNFLFNFFRKREGFDEAEKHLRKALALDPGLRYAQITLDRIEYMKTNPLNY